jgi:integrase
MSERLFKQPGGRIWYATFYDHDGNRIRRSTKCTDKRAAASVLARWERAAADPAESKAATTTLATGVERMMLDREQRGRSDATLRFYGAKASRLTEVMGADTPLSAIDASMVDDYITRRLSGYVGADGAHVKAVSRHTVGKELTTLRIVLKLARRRGEYQRHPDDVLPLNWESGYQPRERVLRDAAELDRLLAVLPPHRRAWVAWTVITAARPAASARAVPDDLQVEAGLVLVRGSKTPRSWRWVAIMPWVEYLVPLVRLPLVRWPDTTASRDLAAACRRAGIEKATLTDLRRTGSTWLRERVGDASLVGAWMGHSSPAMASRVYARLEGERLRKVLLDRVLPHVGQKIAAGSEE